MSYDQSRIIQQAKFTYSPFGKAFEKEIETIENKGIKQAEALKDLKTKENHGLESTEGLFLKKMRNIEIKNEIDI